MSKILCVDFDGVLHSYTSGWQGADVINDPPVPAALLWLKYMCSRTDYEIHIYSARSKQQGGIKAMKEWLIKHFCKLSPGMPEVLEGARNLVEQDLTFPTEKPPAYLTIDDRAICFRGTFPSVLEMDNFKPWNK